MVALVISTIFTSSRPWLRLSSAQRCDDLVEVAIRRRLAVAGEGNVIQSTQLRRRKGELGRLKSSPLVTSCSI